MRAFMISLSALVFMIGSSIQVASASGFSSPRSDFQPIQRKVDAKYERGKHLFSNRVNKYDEIDYCVNTGDGFAKVKKRSLKPFKDSSDVAGALYDCSKEGTKVADILNDKDMFYLMYYLKKRYKLNYRLTRAF